MSDFVFSLDLPNEQELLQEAKKEVEVAPVVFSAIQTQVKSSVDAIMALDLTSLKARENVGKVVDGLGAAPMKSSSEKNKLMSRSLASLSKKGSEGSDVANTLTDLSMQMQDLDPSVLGTLKKGLFGNPVGKYFAKYEKADAVIAGLVKRLDDGKIMLEDDSRTLQIEHDKLAVDTKELYKAIELGQQMDAELERRIDGCNDTERINFIRDEILFPIRQRIQDLQALGIVNQQGMVAMILIVRNNRELIRGIERAKSITIRALESAVLVASALYNQKLVLNAIATLTKATNSMIEKTSEMLKTNSLEIQKQAVESTLGVESLTIAWKNMMDTIDGVNTYRREALPKMAGTIGKYQAMLTDGARVLDTLNSGNLVAVDMEERLSVVL